MSHNTPADLEMGDKGEPGETTYYFDQNGVSVSGDNAPGKTKPGQITSLVSTHVDQPLKSHPDKPNQMFHPSPNGNINSENIDLDHLCGFGSFHPEWLQKFASKKSFMIVFSILAIIQSMCWAYFTATITTLEKRLKISSQTAGKQFLHYKNTHLCYIQEKSILSFDFLPPWFAGIVMTGNEMSQIIFSLVLAHYAGRSHRPRWMAAGVLISALSCFVLASPHFFYGPGNDMLSLTKEYESQFETDVTNSSSLLDSFTTTPPSLKGMEWD